MDVEGGLCAYYITHSPLGRQKSATQPKPLHVVGMLPLQRPYRGFPEFSSLGLLSLHFDEHPKIILSTGLRVALNPDD